MGNKIGDAGAQALAAALPNSQVTELNLKWNKIEDAGAQALAAALPHSQVTELELEQQHRRRRSPSVSGCFAKLSGHSANLGRTKSETPEPKL